MKKLISLVVSVMFVFSVSAHANELYFVNESGMVGVAEPSFSFCGLTEISNYGERAIVNKYGEIVVDFSTDVKKVFPNGLIGILGDNKKIAFFSSTGKQLTDYIYDSFIDTHEKTGDTVVGYLSNMYLKGDGSSDLIPVSKDGKFGYINAYGTVVIPFKYDYAYGFVDGLARICTGGVLSDYGTYTEGKYGYLREDGTEVLPPDSYWIADDLNADLGYAEASDGGKQKVLVDKNGNVSLRDEKGYAKVDASYIIFSPQEGVYGVYSKSGEIVIPPEKTENIKVNGNRFLVANTIRNENNEILYSAPENANIFADFEDNELILIGYAPEGAFGIRKYGFVTWDGNVVFEPEYDSINYIGDGLFMLKKDGEYIMASDYGRVLHKSALKPCIAYDGFVTMYDDFLDTAYIAFNPLKRPAVYLDNQRVNFTDAYPYFEGERTMIPLRSVFEDAGAVVNWDGTTGLISVTKDNVTVSMKIGDNTITIGDKTYESDRAPVAIDNRTYIPLRVFSEGIGMEVYWDSETNNVYLKN